MKTNFRVLINPNAVVSFPLVHMEETERTNGKRRVCVKVEAGELSRVIEKEMKCEFLLPGRLQNTGTIKALRREPGWMFLILEY
jgi:hypothetical protein